jgi:hypothetical protein
MFSAIARLRWPLMGVGVAAALTVPNMTAETDFGPWHFAVTAVGNHEFREVYGFPSRQACQKKRSLMEKDLLIRPGRS